MVQAHAVVRRLHYSRRREPKGSFPYHRSNNLLYPGGMSGELLRRGAIVGDVDSMKDLLEQGSNPCSTDVS